MTNGTIFTSLAEIKSFGPCADGWVCIVRARKAATGRFDAKERFPLVSCLESNSAADVFWLLRKLHVPAHAAFCVEAARGFAESVAHLRGTDAATAAAAYAAYAAAYAAAAAAAYDAAANATAYAAADAAAAAADAAAAAAHCAQQALNKQILRDAILRWEAASPSRRLINL